MAMPASLEWCDKGTARQHEWTAGGNCLHCGRRYPTAEEAFASGLESLINRFSRENASNTPDFILAQYLLTCLAAWNTATQQRDTWYGRDARPCSVPSNAPVSAVSESKG